jgi:hypothetical protein
MYPHENSVCTKVIRAGSIRAPTACVVLFREQASRGGTKDMTGITELGLVHAHEWLGLATQRTFLQ